MKFLYLFLSPSIQRLWPESTDEMIRKRINHHDVILVLLHHWYHHRGHNSPLDVQDVDGLVVLGEEFDLVLSVDCELEWVPVGTFIF